MFAAKTLFHLCQTGGLSRLATGRETGVRRHDQSHPVGVVEQQTANESGQVITVFDPLTQGGNHRLKIECRHRVAIMRGRAEGS